MTRIVDEIWTRITLNTDTFHVVLRVMNQTHLNNKLRKYYDYSGSAG